MKKKLLFILSVAFVTLLSAQQSYYSDVDLTKSGMALKDELATKIANTHTNTLSYRDVWGACKAVDRNPDNSSEFLLIYGYSSSGKTARTTTSQGYPGWNREHTYAKSLGSPNLGTSGPGADSHHLRASDVGFNSDRGNKKFVSGTGNAGSRSGGWYPGDEWKGDVARMMMYMYLRYGNRCKPTGVGIGSAAGTPDDMIDLFLKWNAEDPVSEVEKQRNAYHDSNQQYAQGNRNPFIDNPNLATQIWGGPVAEDRWSNTGGGSDTQAPTVPSGLSVSNETSSSVELSWTASTDDVAVASYEVYVDGNLNNTTSSTSMVVSGLSSSTTYSFTVLAKDTSSNKSAQSTAVSGTTTASSNGGGGSGSSNACVNETFNNVPDVVNSYQDFTWVGDNGFQWTAIYSRTDQPIDGKTFTFGKDYTSKLTSASVPGGISKFTVTTKRFFSGGTGTLDLIVNGTKVGDISYGENQQTVTIDNINISGNVTISIEKNSARSGKKDRVGLDNLSWECYVAASVEENQKLDKVAIYPNPSTDGRVFVKIPTDVNVKNIDVYSILGKKVFTTNKIDANTVKIDRLPTGFYILKVSNNNGGITKRIVVK